MGLASEVCPRCGLPGHNRPEGPCISPPSLDSLLDEAPAADPESPFFDGSDEGRDD